MKTLFSLLICFTSYFSLAQTKRIYFDKYWTLTHKDSAEYYRDMNIGDSVLNGKITDYYMNGNMYGEVEYKNDVKHGACTYYFNNGMKKSSGQMYKGGQKGEWTYYYKNGKPQKTGEWGQIEDFENPLNEYLRVSIAYDTTGKIIVKNGNGKYIAYDERGNIIEKGSYKNGLKKGVWEEYENGRLRYSDKYGNGKFEEGKYYNNEGKEYKYKNYQDRPEYIGGTDAMIKYLSKNIRYPEDALKEGITGKVLVEFMIETSGKVSHVRVKKGVHPSLDQEAIRVVEQMPMWEPGKNRGKPVKGRFVLPINFSI